MVESEEKMILDFCVQFEPSVVTGIVVLGAMLVAQFLMYYGAVPFPTDYLSHRETTFPIWLIADFCKQWQNKTYFVSAFPAGFTL